MERDLKTVLDEVCKVDTQINEMFERPIFLMKESQADLVKVEKSKKEEYIKLVKEAEKLFLEDEEKNKEDIIILLSTAQLAANYNGDIFVENADLINALSDEKLDKFNELKQQHIKLMKELLELMEELKEKMEKEEKEKNPEKSDIKLEIKDLLKVSLYNGIEDIDLEESKYSDLEEEKKIEFNKLREELKTYLPLKEDNQIVIERIRYEMFLILGPNLFDPYQINKETIESLNLEDKKHFDELKEKHEKQVAEDLESIKKNKPSPEKTSEPTETKEDKKEETKKESALEKRIREIREEMAVLIYGKGMEEKAYVGIENTDVHSPTSQLESDEEKDRFIELREELMPLLEKQKKKEERKGKRVAFVKSAKEFYKKHKKAILLVAGLVLSAVALQALLPSIMYFNSVLWNQAILAGASETVGLPVVLHDINSIIGAKIGATFVEGSGIWTLANGSLLNAGAAQAGLLASLGKVALSAGAAGVGATVAVKNAYRLAKEKIQNRKNKEKDPDKKSTLKEMKDAIINGYNKGKEKFKGKNKEEKIEKVDKVIVEPTTKEGEEPLFYRDDVKEEICASVEKLYEEGILTLSEVKKLEKLEKRDFIIEFRKAYARYTEKGKSTEEKVEFTRTDLNTAILNYIKYNIKQGSLTPEQIKQYQEMDKEELRDLIYNDPNFIEYEKNPINPEELEEKGKGSK